MDGWKEGKKERKKKKDNVLSLQESKKTDKYLIKNKIHMI